MRVNEIMKGPVLTVSSQAFLSVALDLLIENGMSGLPVMDASNHLCGIVSEGDLFRRLELGTEAEPTSWWSIFTTAADQAEAFRRAAGRRVLDVMTPSPVTIDMNASLAEAARIMASKNYRRLPVLHDGKLVGMITRADFVRALRTFVEPNLKSRMISDGEIRQRILALLLQQDWAAACSIDVSVSGGRVTLEGGVPNDEQRQAARVVAENVDGVASVNQRLRIFEPTVIPGF